MASSPNSSPPAPPTANFPPPDASSTSPPPTSSPPQNTTPPPTSSPPQKTTPPPTSSPPNTPPSPPQPSNATISSPPSLPPSTGNGSGNGDASLPPPPPPASHVPPPPHPHHTSTAPPRHALLRHSKSPPPPQQQDALEVNIPLVIGVTAGMGAFFVLLVVAYLCSLRKRKRSNETIHYYSDHSRGGSRTQKGVEYNMYSGAPTWTVGPPSTDVGVMKLPPPPGSGPAPPWMAPPPPPPPLATSSSEMSSNAYSGPHGPPLPPPSPNIALGFNKSTFSYDELAEATNGFSQANILGQGGFGYVHKGVLPNGKEVAVKSLKSGSGQGEREFQAEVDIISRVHHRHLVSLVGYCIAGGQRMLVYEFVPNNTLEFHLHGRDRPTMDFPTRLKIALGSAKGLAYLHEDCHPRIIHRDIKAANILLDYKFEAMVADFGLAKLSSDNYTHVSTRVMGTFGYLAPEYASSGKLTEKSDVFSFGVMLLELITGRRPVDTTTSMMEDSLVDWARPLLTRAMTEGNFDGVVDPKLENNFNPNEMIRLVACAAASVRHSGRRRPKMSQIVRTLEGDSSLEDLNDRTRPGYGSTFSSTGSSTDYDSNGSYKTQMRKLHKMALASEDFGSSEFGATSEFGLDPSPSSSDTGNSREIRPPFHTRLGP